jgi:hypothetical protein
MTQYWRSASKDKGKNVRGKAIDPALLLLAVTPDSAHCLRIVGWIPVQSQRAGDKK